MQKRIKILYLCYELSSNDKINWKNVVQRICDLDLVDKFHIKTGICFGSQNLDEIEENKSNSKDFFG